MKIPATAARSDAAPDEWIAQILFEFNPARPIGRVEGSDSAVRIVLTPQGERAIRQVVNTQGFAALSFSGYAPAASVMCRLDFGDGRRPEHRWPQGAVVGTPCFCGALRLYAADHHCKPPLGNPTREEAMQSLARIRDVASDVLEHWDQARRPIVECYAEILTEASKWPRSR